MSLCYNSIILLYVSLLSGRAGLKELDVDHHHCVNSLEKPGVKSIAKYGNRADRKEQEEKVAALEDEVDFLSAKLKEEEQARKAAQREAGPQFLFQG